jgi:replicative DNA helicase
MPQQTKAQKTDELATLTKIPPQNLEAEKSLLGSLMIDKEGMYKVVDIIKSEDYYSNSHALVFLSMVRLFDKKVPIDIVTLTEQLQRDKKLDEIGGATYLATLANVVPSAAHIVEYAKIIAQKSVLRNLISASQEIALMSYKETTEVDAIIDSAEQLIFAVSQKVTKQEFVPLSEVLAESFERIDEIHKNKDKLRGVPTGFIDLDNLLAGLQNSDLIVIAARPSMGKTSLALNMGLNCAVKLDIPVAIFSLEMSKEQLVDRLISNQSGVNLWKMRTGNLDDEDFPKIGSAMGKLSEAPFYIDDSPMLNVMEIRTKARRLQSEKGLGLIIIDYMQLIQGYSMTDNRVQEISEISRTLKGLARELNVPVVALSQLSRAVEMRTPKIPQLADLRESGSIEQDADVVMFIYREEYYDKETEKKNIAEILIKKHRNGPTGDIELFFIPDCASFKTIDKKRVE